ncbi:protocatechuate 3,4-dioxygenase subunit beta [Tepidamorphus sp. 3E244]|uniref:protocatechuate 3,4-dioxygenase subunit beta n=1 Tax=Tepidamorphus sp. 3E244 TaxID=3385498 RepID=UPI0038FCA2E6
MARPPLYQRDRAWHPQQHDAAYKSTVLRSPRRNFISLPPGEGELTGPVFGHEMLEEADNDLIRNYITEGEPIGERIFVHGQVLDQNGKPQPGVLIEAWQANAGGRYRHVIDSYVAPLDPNFGGCGRTVTDDEGRYWFRTIRPGPYPWRNNGCEWRPAHIHLSLFGHAFAQRLVTQLYFEGDPLIPLCPIVQTIKDPAAIDMLVARLDLENQVDFDALAYRFDIVLRGQRSTFFENKREGN